MTDNEMMFKLGFENGPRNYGADFEYGGADREYDAAVQYNEDRKHFDAKSKNQKKFKTAEEAYRAAMKLREGVTDPKPPGYYGSKKDKANESAYRKAMKIVYDFQVKQDKKRTK